MNLIAAVCISTGLYLAATQAHAQTYDQEQRRIAEIQQQAEQERLVAGYRRQTEVLKFAAETYAQQRGETIVSGPDCPTYASEEPITSFWPNSLAARASDPYKNNAAKRCDFRTSGGGICKSSHEIMFSKNSIAGLGVRIDCAIGNETKSFGFANGGKLVPWNSELPETRKAKRRR